MNINILDYMKNNLLTADGAFGTYYAALYGEYGAAAPELANTEHPERVLGIHRDYVKAGAKLLRTNTFAVSPAGIFDDAECAKAHIKAGVALAKEAAGDTVYVAGDIGPVPGDFGMSKSDETEWYVTAGTAMQDAGVDIIWFETFPEYDILADAAARLRERSGIPIMVSFCVNQFGYSNCGFSAKSLINQAAGDANVDCVGLNCGVGPHHMLKLVSALDVDTDKPFSVMPNAGYPNFIQNRLVFADSRDSFAGKLEEIAELGVSVLGGCCGTNPDYIRNVCLRVGTERREKRPHPTEGRQQGGGQTDGGFLAARRRDPNHKLIAVELAPPVDDDDSRLLDAANILKREGVDVVTFPDSPSGRTRADSILMAEKVSRETGLTVMPHLCCRDKNAIAVRASVLGAQLLGIRDFLVITGDPVPVMFRQTTRSVFNFDSVGMMRLLASMNDEVFTGGGITYGGAINQNRLNTKFETDRIKRKMAAGAEFFLTQPVFSESQADVLRQMKKETGAVILVGVMPLVSRRNALFMKNEMAGIEIPDEVVERYDEQGSRQADERCGVGLAKEIIGYTEDFADGYYFSFPFNRVRMLEEILK